MRRNKLDTIIPFNDFLFRTCYYHQLVSVVSSLGIQKDHIFLNTFASVHENFAVEWTEVVPEKELLHQIGCDVKKTRFSTKVLTRSIDAGCPLIVGIDCYYFKERTDTYMKNHAPHYVSVYGYDLDRDTVTIVEPDYINAWMYKEKVVSLSNLLLAAGRYGKAPLRRKDSCRIYTRNDRYGMRCPSFVERYSVEQLRCNRTAAAENLCALKQLLTSDSDNLQQMIPLIIQYLQNLKTFYYAVSLSHLNVTPEQHEHMTALISAYACIRAFMMKAQAKNNYRIAPAQVERLNRKIDEIDVLETWVYENIFEVNRANVL